MSNTQICYGLITYGCDSELVPGNYKSLCQSALDYVSKQRNVYKDKQRKLHVCVYNSLGLNYMAVVSKTFKEGQAFTSLTEVEKAFRDKGLHERANPTHCVTISVQICILFSKPKSVLTERRGEKL